MSLHTNQRVDSPLALVGNTPLIRLRTVEERAGSNAVTSSLATPVASA
jgi:hypothetical protein